MHGFGLFFLLLLLLVIISAACWIGYTRWRAHKNGLPPPPISAYNPFKAISSSGSRSTGVVSWIKDKFSSIKRSRTAGGAYEGSSAGNARRGFGPLDPDGAWDSRVGAEADAYGPVGDYEEQELGLHPPASGGAYGGSGYGPPSAALPDYGAEEMGRGRSRSRDDSTAYIGGSQRGLDTRYDEEIGRQDPFGDGAERSNLRGVSPRPHEEDVGMRGQPNPKEDSPTERKSMFRENM
ncbi:hypothetical protein MMC25_002482 [Agyrium rufum]|nr:hypothetical protein [Agyrium rufum]